jgi:hypothetical protein
VKKMKIMSKCISRYSAGNVTESCNSQDLLLRSWCDYTRGAIPK